VSGHREYVVSDRGFRHMRPVAAAMAGASIQVAESSNAEGPHLWLFAVAPVDFNQPDGPKVEAPIELTVEGALDLADQIAFLALRHYQLRAR